VTITDVLDHRCAQALAGLLDRPVPEPGAPLPLMWHVVLHLPRPAQAELGPDGHPTVGFPTPPAPGLRRRYAGGRVELHGRGPRVGAPLAAETSVVGERTTHGRSGTLHFVTTRTVLRERGEVVLVDDRDVVYLPPQDRSTRPTTPPPVASEPGAGTPGPEIGELVASASLARSVDVDARLLFRFSALTYNAHRIHYDLDWNREVEGHDGLIVHGPLQALLMAEVGTAALGRPPRWFDYRLESVLLDRDGLHVIATPVAMEEADGGPTECVELRVVNNEGRVTARARLR